MELHDRFVIPLYALSFGLIAFAALGQARTTRQGRGTAMLLAVLAVLALRIVGFGASTYVVKSSSFIIYDYAVPIIGLVGAALYMFGPRITLPRSRPRPVPAQVAIDLG